MINLLVILFSKERIGKIRRQQKVDFVQFNSKMSEVFNLMIEKKMERVPVMEEGKIVNILSLSDIASYVITVSRRSLQQN